MLSERMTYQTHCQLLEKYPAQVPRYTSYPSAPHFGPMSDGVYAGWLGQVVEDMPVSLYLHIPYCQKLCWFCGCHTKIAHCYDKVSPYVDALLQEMHLVRRELKRRQPVAHVHFGGGSPTMLSCHDFLRIMEAMRECFAVMDDAEFAVEIDPRTATEAKIASYAKSGVNRVSIGVQDFDVAVQKAINRIQPFCVVYDVISLCRDYGINHISLDLIYGLPFQKAESFSKTIDHALMLNPDRISLFGYAHVPWKKSHMKLIKEETLPDTQMRLRLAHQAASAIEEAGYVPIGLDHFAKPEDAMALALASRTLTRNFQGYTTDSSPVLLGLGASAISNLPQGYAQNMTDIEDYERTISRGSLTTARGLHLQDEDRKRRVVIESLMCYYEADISAVGPQQIATNTLLKELEKDGLLSFSGSRLQVRRDVPQAVRLACAAFDTYFDAQVSRHGQVA